MIEFNDSNASCTKNGISVFIDDICTDEEIFVSSSCVFLGDISTTKGIRAQYNLTIYGNVDVEEDIHVGEAFTCFKDVKARNINIEAGLFIRGSLSCEELSVGNTAEIYSLFCHNADIGEMLIAEDSVDVQQDISLGKSIICKEYVSIGGKATGVSIIAETVDFGEENSILVIPIDKPNQNAQETQEFPDISDSPLEDITNSYSSLAILMEHTASVIERLNERIGEIDKDHLSDLELVKAYGDFIPEYELIAEELADIQSWFFGQAISTSKWFPEFNKCVSVYTTLPHWVKETKLGKMIKGRLLELIDMYIQKNFDTTSKSEWSYAIGNVQKLAELNDPELSIHQKEMMNKLYQNLGMKPFGVLVKLPRA